MVKMKHQLTGSEMYVHESRVEEYLAAGHSLAKDIPAPQEEKPVKPAKTRKTASAGK